MKRAVSSDLLQTERGYGKLQSLYYKLSLLQSLLEECDCNHCIPIRLKMLTFVPNYIHWINCRHNIGS